jgi:hypothetical protein
VGSESSSVSLILNVTQLNDKRAARMTLSESSKVKFIVEGRSVVGKPPVIGFTPEYIIGDLLDLMEKSEKESSDIRDACKGKYLISRMS